MISKLGLYTTFSSHCPFKHADGKSQHIQKRRYDGKAVTRFMQTQKLPFPTELWGKFSNQAPNIRGQSYISTFALHEKYLGTRL